MTHPSEKLLCKEIKERFENKSLIWYTDHSLSHSCAVLQKIEKVVPERLIREYSNSYNVLRVGTLVHDIGMAEPCSTPEECEQVRSRHHLLSEARTKEWFDKHQDSNTPLDFGVAVATIARGHADIENLNNNYYDPRFVGSEYVDIRHLISILVVCDYLDMTYTRINQERIRKGEVPLENASHWKICYYTRLASVDDQGGIELGYALPKFDVYKLIPEHHRLELENILKIIKGFLRSEIYSTELSFTIESTKTIFQDIDKEFLLSQSDFAKILTEVGNHSPLGSPHLTTRHSDGRIELRLDHFDKSISTFLRRLVGAQNHLKHLCAGPRPSTAANLAVEYALADSSFCIVVVPGHALVVHERE